MYAGKRLTYKQQKRLLNVAVKREPWNERGNRRCQYYCCGQPKI